MTRYSSVANAALGKRCAVLDHLRHFILVETGKRYRATITQDLADGLGEIRRTAHLGVAIRPNYDDARSVSPRATNLSNSSEL